MNLLHHSKGVMEKYKEFANNESSWEILFNKDDHPELFKKHSDVMFWARPENYAKLEVAINKSSTTNIKAISVEQLKKDMDKLIQSVDFFTLQGRKFTPEPNDLMTKEGASFIVHPHTTWAAKFMGHGSKFGIKTGPFRNSNSTTCVNWIEGNMLPSYHVDAGNIYMIIDGSKDPVNDPKWAYVASVKPDGTVHELSDSNNQHIKIDDNGCTSVKIGGYDLLDILDTIIPHAAGGNRIKKDSQRYKDMIEEGKETEAKEEMIKNPDSYHIHKLIDRSYDFSPEELKFIAKTNDPSCLMSLVDKQDK